MGEVSDRPTEEDALRRDEDREAYEPGESLWEIVRTIFYALLIALVFRTVFFQPFSIPSGSMKPTLLIGDYLFVSKYAYGYSKYATRDLIRRGLVDEQNLLREVRFDPDTPADSSQLFEVVGWDQ